MQTELLNKNEYFVLFIDDFTKMTWIYFIRYKSQVFEEFKIFKKLAEVKSGCKLKAIRSDNGMEYNSKEFKHFCEMEGIEPQLTIAYTPKQNGTAEKKNRSVVEMVRCIYQRRRSQMNFGLKLLIQLFICKTGCPLLL